jgi:hypothetical protein
VHEEGHDGIVQRRHVVLRVFVYEDCDLLSGAFGQHCASMFIILSAGGQRGASHVLF